LTAYILLTLLESDINQLKSQYIIAAAFLCITKPRTNTDLYTKILTAYALQLAEEREEDLLISLKSLGKKRQEHIRNVVQSANASSDDEIYWQGEGIHFV
jgi:hypothetical protein